MSTSEKSAVEAPTGKKDVFTAEAPRGKAIEARYFKGELLPEHAENPLITALGPYWTGADIVRELSVPVAFSESERTRSQEYRMHAIARLGNMMVALPAQLDVVTSMHLLIREHYAHQSPLDNGLAGAQDRYSLSSEGKLTAIYPHGRGHAYCGGIFGVSGSGKTTVIDSALRLLPQVILHPDYGLSQVVYIKIDCPRSASLKDTLKLLLETYDDLLGTPYTRELTSKATVADYANKVHRVARRHYTGVFVLDEIQNALHAAAGQDPLFDFFVNFTNIVRVPVIVAGTPRAARLFRRTLRLARRVSSHGITSWQGITNPRDWDRFCDSLSRYQWLKRATTLCESERRCLWTITQGLPGVAVPLFQLAQYAAIQSGRERLSNRIFAQVFDEKMTAVKPMLRAIRSGNKTAMMKYDDILGDTLKDIVTDMKVENQHNLFYEAAIRHDRLETGLNAVSSLMAAGIPQEVASTLVDLIQREYPDATRQQLCHEASLRFYRTKESQLKARTRTPETDRVTEAD